MERGLYFLKTLIRKHYLILIFLDFILLENFNVRSIREEIFLRITHIATKMFFDFHRLIFRFKEEQFFLEDLGSQSGGENRETAKFSSRENFSH